MRGRTGTIGLLGILVLLVGRCDSVQPEAEPLLVVEGFLDTEKPVPALEIRQTRSVRAPYPADEGTAVADARVVLTVDGRRVGFAPDPSRPGRYLPQGEAFLRPGARFAFSAEWGRQRATAEGALPPPVRIDSLSVQAPPEPVEAVLLDSLNLDSLGVVSRQGFIYPVEVSLWWLPTPADVSADTLYWVRTQLKPFMTFSSRVVDFFLRPEQIRWEHTIGRDARGRRRWTGVYAVPVETRDTPLPEHRLRVSVLRSGQDYARYASSRDAPERREPVSNVTGGLGIVAGISVDSLVVRVRPAP